MSKKNPISFIQQKIQELKTALFFPETGSLLNIPNYLVNNIQVDEAGNIWFIISKPAEYIDLLDKNFHCKLDFFKKGVNHYVKVQGRATIFDKQEEMPFSKDMREIKKCLKNKQMAAVKVEIEQADYFVTPAENDAVSKNKKSFFTNLFPQYNNTSFYFKNSFSN
ncbi:MAG: pyridoxamine 5'-phosphate oxidase family protein [Bacteroidetes bacterium]|nr:pyridoxamine 5'-phosphate oxidase family protein [Bacteroidota bacterium]MBS1974535.1 pyridoxamine 5'-phosphate oxidase family protein [Bacteroidota bacterium]